MNKSTYVELRPGFEEFYQGVVVGARGWIEDKKEDGDGFSLIFVRWDRDHWRYNGQKDGWTYESHFREVEDTTKLIARVQGDEDDTEEDRADFSYVLREALKVAAESDGFMLIAAVKVEDILGDGEIVTLPLVFSRALNQEAANALMSQVGNLNLIMLHDLLLKDDDDTGRNGPVDLPSDL